MVPSESVEPVDVKLKLVIPVFRKPVVGVTWAAAVGAMLSTTVTDSVAVSVAPLSTAVTVSVTVYSPAAA